MTQTLDHQIGGLYIQSPNRQQLAFPLKHTDVQATVMGNISRVEVRQTFENPFTTTLEATYIFPLPDEAAVDDMEIRIGDRTIKGNIKKRQEAVAIYEKAKQQGRTAGLLEQERDNIFTQSLANIKPGEQIDVIIRYTDSLKFDGGNYEFVFPMVVGPRYIPGIAIDETGGSGSAPAPMTLNQDTDCVPDASRLNAPILPPGIRSGHDISVTVEIGAGVEIQDIHSPSHQIQLEREGHWMRVTLSRRDTVPNKDFILRYQVAGDRTQTTVLSQADYRGGHFAVYLIPAINYHPYQFVPKEVVFLIDTSGSQGGAPLMKCQELMRRFINGLNPSDTFAIIDFADTTRQLSPVPLPNTPQNRTRAIHYINRLNAGGGTQMLRGIRAVLNFPEVDPGRLRSIVLLTDGYIGNENQILAEIQRHLKPGNRLHSFGAGSSVNRFLLNRIAEIGRGISRIIRHDEPTVEVAEQFFGQINNPVLTNIQLDWHGEGEPPIIYPPNPPDLFAEQPLVLLGRKKDLRAGMLHITGILAGGHRYEQILELNFAEPGNPGIAQLWGRARIKDLMNQMLRGETKVGVEAVTDTALTYQLLSQYTAFVAVSDEVRVNPREDSVSVQVPVEMPDGVSYEGIFGNVARSRVDQDIYAWEAIQQVCKRTVVVEESDISLIDPGMLMDESEELFLECMEELPRTTQPLPQRPQSPGAPTPPQLPQSAPVPHQPASPSSSRSSLKRRGRLFAGIGIGRNQQKIGDRLQIVSATELEPDAIAHLTRHLQQIKLPPNVSGDLVFEFHFNIKKRRVQQVVLDAQASSLHDEIVIDAVRRSLLTWRGRQAVSSTIHLLVRIQA